VAGFISAGTYGAREAKASAFFPFIFVRAEEYATPLFINHERIHFRQQLEMLFIGNWLLQLIEDIYSRVFLKMKSPEYYLYRAIEQEAYRNQHNLSYLQTRPLFNTFLYMKDKRVITFIPDKAPEVNVGEKLTK
jgi:hypothetical protein